MTSGRKKPGVAFWASVVVVGLVVYVLSLGPVCWAADRFDAPDSVRTWVGYFYLPVYWLAYFPPTNAFMNWYVGLWT